MVYMGSKANIASSIAPFIHGYMLSNGLETYVEPFVGGANMMSSVTAPVRKGYDKNRYVIALFKHLQNNGELPDDVSRALFNDCRVHYTADDGYYEDWYLGAVGFLAGFNGRFYDGCYAEGKEYDGKFRDYYSERKENLLEQIKTLQDVEFAVADYRSLTPDNQLIYCDPPYANTKQYAVDKNFDTSEFWDTVRKWSKNNIVLVSEENGPDDFDIIWEQEVTRTVNAAHKSQKTEKLFIHKSLNQDKMEDYNF